MLGHAVGEPQEGEGWNAVRAAVWVFPALPSACLFFTVCFFSPIPPPSQPGSNSALNRSLKGRRQTSSMKPSWSHPRALPVGDWSHSAGDSHCHLLLSSVSLPAKPWRLWKPSAFLWLPCRSPRWTWLPSHGASSRNVFLIFIVHSVCYRCVHCNYCNSLHMCCYEMGAFQAMPSYFFPFLKPKYIISTYVSVSLPRFFILFQRSVWAAKEAWRVHRAGAACFPHGRTVAFDFVLCGFYLILLFSSFHAHNQACLQTHTAHRCCSWSSHLHPGEDTCVRVQNRRAHVRVQTAFRWKISWRLVVVFFLLLSGREGKDSRKVISFSLFFKNSNWIFSDAI